MILSKLANLLSSSLTLGHPTSSEVESTTKTNHIPSSSKSITVTETNDPLKNFLDKSRLKELVYEPDISFRDDFPGTKFPLTYRPPPEGSRSLLYVMKLGDFLHDEVTYFFTESETVKKKEQDIVKLKLSLNYNSTAMTKAFGFDPYHIYTRQDVIYVLEHGPIRSAEQLAKSINDTITNYHFISLRGIQGIDPLLFTYLSCPNERIPNENPLVRCMLIPFAPWEFMSKDFIRFTSIGVFTDSSENVDVTWSYILDACAETNCEYFILTTYDNWAFGRFSHTLSEAFISEPISNKAEVLKYLTYWILTSCWTAGTTEMDSTILKHRLEYELVVKRKHLEDAGKRRKYEIHLVSSKRVPDIVIKKFPIDGVYDYELPEPVKEWNRWCKDDSDKKRGSSSEEVGGPEGVHERIEESLVEKMVENDETVGEKVSGAGEQVLTTEENNKEVKTGENFTREEEDVNEGGENVNGEAGIGEVDSGGVGEDVMEDTSEKADEGKNIKDDVLEHEVVSKLMESSNHPTIEETTATDSMETETVQEPEQDQTPIETIDIDPDLPYNPPFFDSI